MLFQSITGLTSHYYNVTEDDVTWLAQVSMVLMCLTLVPTTFLSEVFTMRTVVISTNVVLLIGCILKTVALQRNLYGLLMVGQVITQNGVMIDQLFIAYYWG